MEFNVLFKYLSSVYMILLLVLVGLAYFLNKFSYNNSKESIFKFKSTLRYFAPSYNRSFDDNAIKAVMILYIAIFFIVILDFINRRYLNSLNIILGNIIGFEGICIAFVTFVISAIIFTVTLAPGQYYLFFSRKDVLKKYQIGKAFMLICVSCLISIICTALLGCNFVEEVAEIILCIYELVVIILLTLGAYSLYVVGKVSFSDNKFELKMLNYLYKIFWQNKKLYIESKVNEIALNDNLGYLLSKYEKVVLHNRKLFNLKSIDQIEYISIDNDIKWQKKARNYICIVGFILLIISIVCCFIQTGKAYSSIIINILIYLAIVGIFNLDAVVKCCGRYFNNLVLDRRGYYFKLKNNKDKFIGEVSFYRNIFFEQYIHNVKNIMAFYCIVSNSNDEYRIIENSYMDAIDFLKENEDKKFSKWQRVLYYLPVIAGGYYFFINKVSNGTIPKSIKDLFNDINLSDKEKKKFHKVLNGFIVSASIYQPNEKDKEALRSGCDRQNYYDDYIGHNNYWQQLSISIH